MIVTRSTLLVSLNDFGTVEYVKKLRNCVE